MPPVSARSTDGITDCIHDSLRQPDLQSRRVRLTSPVLQAAALAGTNYPLLPLFMQSPHQPLLQEGGPAPTADGLILHQVSVPLGARSPMGSFCPAPTSYRGCFSPPCQHRQLQALLSTLEKPAREAADKEALRLPDKAARHLWGSCHRRWHGQPRQAGRGRSARHGAVGDPGSPPQRRMAPQTVLCSSASALPAGDHTCLPREPEEKPGPPPFPLMCARHVGAAGAQGGTRHGSPVEPGRAPSSVLEDPNPAPYCGR